MAIFFTFVINLLNLLNSFQSLPILPESQQHNLQKILPEDFKLKSISALAICNQTHIS